MRARDTAKIAVVTSLTLVAVIASICTAMADDSTEAGTFGTDGLATQILGVHYEGTSITGLTELPGGDIVALQRTKPYGDQYLNTYSADGTPDPSAPRAPGPEGRIFPAAHGKSLLLGYGQVTRLDPDGTPDPTFGKDGTAELAGEVKAVVELGSGKIAGVTIQGAGARVYQYYIGIELLNADGSLDKSTSVPGTVSYDEHLVREIVPTSDGGALIVGVDFMTELGPDGSVNSGFGREGLVTGGATFAGGHFLADGSIEVVGSTYLESRERSEPVILRYSAAGTPDPAFGVDGRRMLDVPNWAEAQAASWGPDGSVVFGGRLEVHGDCPGNDCGEAPALIGIDPAGGRDPGFGEDGVLRLEPLSGSSGSGERSEGVATLSRRPDGSILVAGSAPPNGSVAFLLLVSARGQLVSSFGEEGIVRLREPAPAGQSGSELLSVPGGGLLVAGTTDVGTVEHPILARYRPDGGLDRSFGRRSGYVDLAPEGYSPELATAEGKALVGFAVGDGSSRVHLRMLRVADGKPVRSFGSKGSVFLQQTALLALSLGADGGSFVLGASEDFRGPALWVLRLDPAGRPDPRFGRRGRVSLAFKGDHSPDCSDLTATRDGGALIGCLAGRRFAVARLRPDGTLDPRFGAHGWATSRAMGQAESIKLRVLDSRVYLAGTEPIGKGLHRLVLVRFDSAGRLDAGYGDQGVITQVVRSPVGPTAILPRGKSVVVVLGSGRRPVFTFAPGGSVAVRGVKGLSGRTGPVSAALSRGRLIIGWSDSRGGGAEGSYYLSDRLSLR